MADTDRGSPSGEIGNTEQNASNVSENGPEEVMDSKISDNNDGDMSAEKQDQQEKENSEDGDGEATGARGNSDTDEKSIDDSHSESNKRASAVDIQDDGDSVEDVTAGDDSKPLVRTENAGSDDHVREPETGKAPLESSETLNTNSESTDSIAVNFMPMENGADLKSKKIEDNDIEFMEIPLDEEDERTKDRREAHRKGGKYSDTMRVLFPIRPRMDKSKSPLDQIGLFSFMSYHWVTRVIGLAYKNKLTMEKILPCSENDAAMVNALRLERHWDEVLKRDGAEKASFSSAVWGFARTRCIVAILIQIWPFAVLLTAGVLIQALLQYLEQPEADLQQGLLLVLAVFGSELLRVFSQSITQAMTVRTGVRARNAIMTMIYRKMIRLRSLQDKTVGELVNLCTNDAQRFHELLAYFPLLYGSIVLGILNIIYAYMLVGPSGLLGTLGAFFVFWPLQAVSGILAQILRGKSIRVTDRRVRLMNEILTCVKLIKMYAWEMPFSRTVESIRREERKFLQYSGYAQSIGISLGPVVANIATILTITVYLVTGNDLTAATAFTLVALFNTIRTVVGIVPWLMRIYAETRVAKERIKQLLLMAELEPIAKAPDNPKHAVEINGATFAWEKQKDAEKEKKNNESEERRGPRGRRQRKKKAKQEKSFSKGKGNGDIVLDGHAGSFKTEDGENDMNSSNEDANGKEEKIIRTLFGISLILPKGQLLGVCGGVGSGKSSLISAILSQMRLVDGEIAVAGTTAYAAQQAFIFNSTLQENILFDKPYKETKYQQVVHAACLQQDLDMLPHGDQTEIGEKGINLSGGQKQRVSLARALYADCDVYLLDDPLSAVDAHVGQHIFQHYILEALRGKTVLFVTHQLQYLNKCDKVLFMKDGRIEEYGTHTELMSEDKEYAGLIKTFHAEDESIEEEEMEPQGFHRQLSKQMSVESTASRSSFRSDESDETSKDDGKLIVAEEKEAGTVKWAAYNTYFKAAGGYAVVFLILFLFILYIGLLTFNNWWLSYWINQGSGNTSIIVDNVTVISDSMLDNPRMNFYAMIYGVSILVVLFFSVIRSLIYMTTCLRASSNLHNRVFIQVFRSPMSFFDTTPTGRILSRFSKDIDEIDVWIPLTLDMATQNFILVGFAILTICIVFPWFLIALAILVIVFVVCIKFFRAGIRDCKRLDNVTRSPWVSLLTSTIQGLPTIHAYKRIDKFTERFCQLVEDNSVAFLYSLMCAQWIRFRMDMLTLLIVVTTALLAVLTHGLISPAVAGLALSYTIQVGTLLNLCVNFGAEAEARFTCVERMRHYAKNIPEEAPAKVKGHEPPKNWPTEGNIVYKKVKLRYREKLPLVLKSVSFDIKPQEKIGIVGRTGSGKSSLGVALFRLVELADGEILIDGLDVSKMGLEDLRTKLSIIPQDPVLFVGTVRYNLDPFSEHSDEELWSALEKAYMKNAISALEKQLEAPVVENGENFSVGERQLICMARAILRNSKIMMLDEATAAIDTETDSLIQETIRNAFKDCTMLTIAHRLNTVLSCDRVMVMDEGRIVEFDKPSALLAKPESQFSAMMAAAEKMKGESNGVF
ncbi:ATP-binding cassette sub-family C member 5-like [Ptychodera flava]|uniref:ATP-binding cassette sub-family C member 5-like n=1 Tax=Ptychodera flava TaxID=63121 RepID=UPI00396A6707